MSIFINDIMVIGTKKSGHIERIKAKLIAAFEIVDVGPISFYLRLKVKRDQQKRLLKLS